MAYGGHNCWIYTVCGVTIWRHIHVCKPTFLLTQHAYYSTRTLFTRCCKICHCNEHKLSALQVRRPEQNTALNAKTEQFVTAKISGKALKQESRKCHVSSVYNGKNIRLRFETVEQNTLNATTGHFTTAKISGCAKGSSNSIEQRQ